MCACGTRNMVLIRINLLRILWGKDAGLLKESVHPIRGMGVRMKKYVMALDQGTTSSRCILFDKAGHMKSVVQREFHTDLSKVGLGGA